MRVCSPADVTLQLSGCQPGTFANSVGDTVVERLACSPLTKVIRVRFPAGPVRPFACRNRAGRLAGLLGYLTFPPPLHSGDAPYSSQSTSSAR
ncbi:hypothetical protein PR048_019892 [Dryococelus australis]|uniref:Uncharacterized protein n=1 Tax=Dryococelus australis TaxID=614101 RepID=A0ABQ9H4R2_9NEOP|nr:hypothetical protein PR048_019892 [Dryococelus australis]